MENVITEISLQKRKKDRVNVYIDGEFAFGVPAITVAELRLKVGEVVDVERLATVVREAEAEQAWNDGLKYVVRSVRSLREIREHLAKKGYDQDATDRAVAKLVEYGYADDRAYARAYVADHRARSGRAKLEYELKHKGVSRTIIDEILDGLDSTEDCIALARKYMRGKTLDYETKARLSAHLSAKGFDWDTVHSAVRTVEDEWEEQDG